MKRTMFISMLTAALMGSAYANTNYTATPGTDCSPPYYIYGTYADTGDVSGGSAAVYAVATGGYEYLGHVYGGYTESGNATGNTVTMDGGEVRYVHGGYVYVTGDATENDVIIGDGYASENVYGGYVNEDGDAARNTVTMSGGEVDGYVFGGFTNVTGDATENDVIINGGYVYLDVYGGDAINTGNAARNTVTMSEGVVDGSVVGGCVDYTGDATENDVTINGGHVQSDVIGGVVYVTGDAARNTVTMSGGEVDGSVYGGCAYDTGNATGNTATMTGGEVADTLYGGYTNFGNATDNTVTLSDGKVGGNVYGGQSDEGDTTGNNVTMTGGEVSDDVYGGFTKSGIANNNTVSLSGGEIAGSVYGGYTEDGEASDNTVTMSGKRKVESSVYGGHADVGEASRNTIKINDDSFVGGAVMGGYVREGQAADNTVTLEGGLIEDRIYGGYSTFGNATDNTVNMTGGEVGGSLNGGYAYSGDATGNMVRLVGAGASYTVGDTTYQGGEIAIHGSVYAGRVEEGGTSENNTVHIHGTGIYIGGGIDFSQQLNFHLVNAQAGAPGTPMVTLGGALDLDGVELGFYGDTVTDWAAFKGKSITLVSMTNETITGLVQPTDSVDITDEAGKTVATATLTLSEDLQTLFLTNIQGVGPVPPPVPTAGPDALDVTLVNSLWASSAYVREFVRLSEAQGYALKDGDTTVWGGGFGAFMHVTGDKGFKSNGGGYGIGVRHAFSANTQAGISLGQGFGSYHNSGADGATVHQRAILAAATASTRVGKDFSLGGHLAYGCVRNRADCRLDGESGRARWNDNVFNLGVQAAYDFHVTEATAITPFLGLDWMNGAHESFNGAYGRHYSHGRLNELRMPVGVTVSTSAEVGSTKLLPQLSVAYVPSLAQQVPHADVTRADGDYRVKGYAPGRNAFMLNAGVNAVFSDSWSAGAFYTLEMRRHSVDQSVNASVRYTF